METTTFAELPLGPKLQAAIEAAGYARPTPIQAQAIPVAVTGRDVLGIAQTGTGKTASFVLPMIQRLETGRARARMPRSLILAPTRELAAQVAQSFEKYGVNHKLSVALLIGGVSFDDQEKKLDRGADVLIATPGRLLDHFQRGKLMLMGVEILVIDEADRMLDMGFIPDIEKICKLLPPRRQTLFFSATMPPEIQRLVDTFLNEPARIEVARPATTAKTITQLFRFCSATEDWAKREVLRELIREYPVKNAIIFCNRKRDVAILFKSLTKHGFNAGALHGDMDQKSRMETLDKFRSGDIMLLAASDVAARGLDIPDVSHVFNFDIPWAGDDYVHRIGRTGRAGKEGMSLSIVTPEDLKLIKDIEKVTGEQPQWTGEAPTAEDFADAARRRRGRGGRRGMSGRSARGSEERAARTEATPRRGSASARSGGQGGQRDEAPRRERERTPRERDRPPANDRQEQGARRRQRSGQVSNIPGMEEQPYIDFGAAPTRPKAEHQPRRDSERRSGRSDSDRDGRPKARPERTASENNNRRETRQTGERKTASSGSSFADNLPAFLRRPVRPTKEPVG
ncbi:MAG: DEAD/DEAH box helicase [Hyphomicrobiaceae bacterium]